MSEAEAAFLSHVLFASVVCSAPRPRPPAVLPLMSLPTTPVAPSPAVLLLALTRPVPLFPAVIAHIFIPPVPLSTGVLHTDSLPVHLSVVHIPQSVFRVSMVFEFDEGVGALEVDFLQRAVAGEHELEGPGSGLGRESAHVDTVAVGHIRL